MSTVKRLKLHTNYSFDFHLIGIISKSKEYTVSWAINQALGIVLRKEVDLEIEMKSSGVMRVSNYTYENELLKFSLLSNTLITGPMATQKLLVPSLGSFDYLLKIEELEEISDLDVIFNQLRNTDKIDSLVKLDVNKIKEKESFLF
ncbi:IPExxxVDY family protein [Reichenbachiella agarivorans]|uniref:IPExxxVDY family protein n=1 Tax=Reichenbachiella agarivorans TaxID=2979464 RepID=A0ABY6CL84_9BACT|nr:IPExxxVDY family protein [Reichenbachiella agarivorans]UXP31280.1 IPExxxVDY family protein [Reichenbachiella agarivorans]